MASATMPHLPEDKSPSKMQNTSIGNVASKVSRELSVKMHCS